MDRKVPIAEQAFTARAYLAAERLDARGWAEASTLATAPLALELAGRGVAVLFRYGVVVFFGADPDAERRFLAALQSRLARPYATPETETLDVRVAAGERVGVGDGTVTLDALSIERLQLIADVLGKSVMLALHEARVGATFDRIEPLARELEDTGRIGATERELLRQIGATLRIDHTMIGRAAVSEKPELLWEHPALEGLYIRLEDEFELRERHAALERRLGVVSRIAETLLDLVQSRHALRVEWYIVALILVDVVLSVYGIVH